MGGLEPLDPFVLQRLDENLRAACIERPRRISYTWPSDQQPILACHMDLPYILGRWPVPRDGVDTLEVRLRFTVSAEAEMFMGVGILTGRGLSIRSDDLTEFAANATYDNTFEVDVTGERGQIANVVLVIRSGSGSTESANYSGDYTVQNYTVVSLAAVAHGFTWTAGDRWALDWNENPAGTDTSTSIGFPTKRTVIWKVDADTVHCWPGFSGEHWAFATPGWAAGDYVITKTDLGQAELHGVSFCNVRAGFTPLTRAYRPANSPVSHLIAKLYGRARKIFVEQSRIFWLGPSIDYDAKVGGVLLNAWGTSRHISTSYNVFGHGLVAGYDASVLDGTTQRRATTRVAGFIRGVANNRPGTVLLTLRATLSTFSSTWSGDPEYSDEQEIIVPYRTVSPANDFGQDASGLLVGFKIGNGTDPSYHYLRGAAGHVGDLNSRQHAGLVPFEFIITDDQPTSAARMLVLEVKSAQQTLNGYDVDDIRLLLDGTSWCAWTHEVLGGVEV